MRDLKPCLLAFGIGISTMLAGCSGFGTSSLVPDEQAYAGRQTADETLLTEGRARAAADARSQDWSRLSKEGREHMALGRHGMAEQSFVSAYLIAQRFRHSDVRRRVSFGNLERIAHSYTGAHAEVAAARVLQFIADETQDIRESQYPGLSDLMAELGDLQLTQADLEGAESTYRRALALKIDRNGANSSALISLYRRLGRVLLETKQATEALSTAEKQLELAEFHYSATDLEVLTARMQVGAANKISNRLDDAEASYVAAIAGFQTTLPGSMQLAAAQNTLALLYLKSGRVDEAFSEVGKALVIFDQKEVTGLALASLLDTKAQVLAAQGKTEAADSTFASVMSESTSAPAQARIGLYESFETFLLDQNRTREASEIRNRIEKISSELNEKQSAAGRSLDAASFTATGAAAATPAAVNAGPPSHQPAQPQPDRLQAPVESSPDRAVWDEGSTEVFATPLL